MFRLTGAVRKPLLLLHITAAALWFGVDIALGTLAMTAVLTDDPRVAGTALQALPLFAIWPMFGASLVTLVTGVLLGLGSKYGLVKYWWVAIKLTANLLMSTLIVLSLRPGVDDAAELGRRMVAGDLGATVPSDLLYPVFVAPSLLLLSFALSVLKPKARLRGRKRSGNASPRPAAASRPRVPVA